jgi:hypothetical protein
MTCENCEKGNACVLTMSERHALRNLHLMRLINVFNAFQGKLPFASPIVNLREK